MNYKSKIGKKKNYDDSFFRMACKSVCQSLRDKFFWEYNFADGENKKVTVPMYYSMKGNERFLYDAFTDDIIPSKGSSGELNIDVVPRGHIVLNSITMDSSQFANPNVIVPFVIDVDGKEEVRKLNNIRPIPLKLNFNVGILLNTSENDIFLFYESAFNTLALYKEFRFTYKNIKIDCLYVLPDDFEIKNERENNLTSDDTISVSFDLTVSCSFPAQRLENAIDYNRVFNNNLNIES